MAKSLGKLITQLSRKLVVPLLLVQALCPFAECQEPRVPKKVIKELNSMFWRSAVDEWKYSEPIWPYLKSKEAKIRFVKQILTHDNISKLSYLKDVHVCRHFARKMYFRYSKNRPKDFNFFYNVSKAPVKYRIPIREVHVKFGDAERPEGHVINSVFLGGDKLNSENWLFFEPQSDEFLFRQNHNLWKDKGNHFVITEDHNQPLNFKCEYKIPWSKRTKRDIRFILSNNLNFKCISKFKVFKEEYRNYNTTSYIYEKGSRNPYLYAFLNCNEKQAEKILKEFEYSGLYSEKEMRVIRYYHNSRLRVLRTSYTYPGYHVIDHYLPRRIEFLKSEKTFEEFIRQELKEWEGKLHLEEGFKDMKKHKVISDQEYNTYKKIMKKLNVSNVRNKNP